ncbi:glycerophosphodiester phosphodiesterase family protein [Cohaesibacter intestini]|uniref:glycerophosphodiester phosphodiesterase family protein n=1 Tax=Cohaesibacter intestini TaxID=2211145 RepID=UPI000DEB5085|nr:glycerophosphodiester phosphodiesterase family protein [Cohaesibacter intestini]
MPNQDLSWLTRRPIAHRGLHDVTQGRVENCRQSFDAAISHDFSIELDVQITKDGKAAVFHDYSLERLTNGTGRLDEMTLSELSIVSFKNGSDPIEELPSLLAHIDGRVPLVIELKTPNVQDGRLERAVAASLSTYDGPVALMSFSPMVVTELHQVTDRPRGIVSCDFFRDKDGADLPNEERYQLTHLLHAGVSKPDFISYCQKDFPAPSVDLMKALTGLPVICWTTKSVEDHVWALKHCDQVTFEGYDPDAIAD